MSERPCTVEVNLPDGRTKTYVAFLGILAEAFERIADELSRHDDNEFPPVPTGWDSYDGPAKPEHRLHTALTM